MRKYTFLSQVCLTLVVMVASLFVVNASVVTGTVNSDGLDFNKDGSNEFYIADGGFEVTHTNSVLEFSWSENGNNIWTNGNLEQGGWDVVKPLTLGTSIGSNGNWEALGDAYIVNFYDETLFPMEADSYVGFRIKIGGNTHYGWAKVHVSGSLSTGIQVQWMECAYENTPNTPIAAGSTGSGIVENELNAVSYFPNPIVNEVTIQAVTESASDVQVYDIRGKLISAPVVVNDEQIKIDFSESPIGVYFIRFNNHLVKVVKQ